MSERTPDNMCLRRLIAVIKSHTFQLRATIITTYIINYYIKTDFHFRPSPPPSYARPVNDKSVIQRSCFWEDINAPRDACYSVSTPSYIRTQFCETCTTDGCNGAAQYGPTALLTVASVVLAKLLVL